MMGAEERFWSKVDQAGPHECWPWVGATSSHGYGNFWLDGTTRRAHRVAYEWAVGPIPTGLDLDHLCRVRHCVNPSHLEPVTRRENTLRGASPTVAAYFAETCTKGHSEWRVDRHGHRICIPCRQEWTRAYQSTPEFKERRVARVRARRALRRAT